MKSFKAFRLDRVNHILWHNGDRVPIAPKSFDVLAYLIEHAGRVVTQDEILEAVWSETYVNPEVLRKYILEIRKALGDRPVSPEFIETLPKRGYRFIAPIIDESIAEPVDVPVPHETEEQVKDEGTGHETTHSEKASLLGKRKVWNLALIPIMAIVVAVGLSAHSWLARHGANPTSSQNPSIAVLPFVDMSPGSDEEYFADGLSEQLINDLAKVSGLKVVGRSSAFQFKGKNEDLRDVGRKLGVANVLEGTVRRDGNHMRITAELTKADDGFQLWSQTYDREVKDILAVQDEIAQAATEALQLKLLRGNRPPLASNVISVNPEAFQAYLQSEYFLGRGQSKEDLGKALAYADTAIKLDEKYAPAWALRSSVQNMMAQLGMIDVTEGFRKARGDAEKSIALDPTSASGYLALGWTQISYDWDWGIAKTCLTKAAGLEPGNVDVFRFQSTLSSVLGSLDEAVKSDKHVAALDPLRANSHVNLGYLLYLVGRYDEAQAEQQKALELNPQAAIAHGNLGKILIAQEKPQQALAEVEKEPTDWARLTGLALAYHALGREQDANSALAGLITKNGTVAAYQIAEVYAFRGESDKSFEWLERAYRQRDPGLPKVNTDPLFKSLRRYPRYTELLKQMHLPT